MSNHVTLLIFFPRRPLFIVSCYSGPYLCCCRFLRSSLSVWAISCCGGDKQGGWEAGRMKPRLEPCSCFRVQCRWNLQVCLLPFPVRIAVAQSRMCQEQNLIRIVPLYASFLACLSEEAPRHIPWHVYSNLKRQRTYFFLFFTIQVKRGFCEPRLFFSTGASLIVWCLGTRKCPCLPFVPLF